MYGVRRRIHFIGVGGIGMSGLAEILLNLGYEVSGSDLHASDITSRLEQLGLRFFEGHRTENIADAEIAVKSAAVDEDNVEIQAAQARGVPILHRSELLADLIRLKPNAVVVGGSHGKTTTTSMISAILDRAHVESTSIVGGILQRSGTNARWGKGDYIVAEADEHDGSFLRLRPTIGVVTNIDAEHLEYYGTLDNIKRAFVEFCNGVPFYGYSVLCLDDANSRAVLPEIDSVSVTYGLSEDAELIGTNLRITNAAAGASLPSQLRKLRTRIDVTSQGDRFEGPGRLGTLEFNAIGEHNARNALAACAVGLCLGIAFETIAEGLQDFDGVRRRLQVVGERNGVVVVEDYAHHPTEIAATLAAVRSLEPGRIIVVFQPHLYSRTKFFAAEFARALQSADHAIVTAIYPSREAPMPGVDSSLIVDAARDNGTAHVELFNDMNDLPKHLSGDLRSGDVVLVLGAGNIDRIASPILEAIPG